MVGRILMLTLLMGGMATALAASPEQQALAAYFESVDVLEGSFEQVTLDDNGVVVEHSDGVFAMERPNRFRWSYEEPYEQEIVGDGEMLWVYDVDLEQVTVRPLDEVLGFGPALLLSGDYNALVDTFYIETVGDGWLTLTPRESDWEFQSIRLRFVDDMPRVIEVDGGLGQATRLSLSNLRHNHRIEPGRFTFVPPPGVDVIGPSAGT